METTLSTKRPALAESDDKGAGEGGGDGRATTNAIMSKVLNKTQREGSSLVGIEGKAGMALGVSDVTVGAVGSSAATESKDG